jgi:hypothetical protein
MAEELILTDPIVPPTPASTTKYRVSSFTMDLETVMATTTLPPPPPAVPPTPEPGLVTVKLKDDAGNYSFYQYTGKLATNMIKQLNTANLTTKSMQRRILEKLSADGFIPGTVAGTPEAPSTRDNDLDLE